MRLKDLHEKLEGRTAVFTFGRMNPPTIGHEKLLNKLKKGQRELSQQLSRTPSMKELADYVEISEDEVKHMTNQAEDGVKRPRTSVNFSEGDQVKVTKLKLLS